LTNVPWCIFCCIAYNATDLFYRQLAETWNLLLVGAVEAKIS